MQLHDLQQKTKGKSKKRVGRGGVRGKTSGRGQKGQKARAGHRIRPEIRDMLKKLPKRRGYGKNRARTINDGSVKPIVVNLRILESAFSGGEHVTPEILLAKGLIARLRGKTPLVKILGKGKLTKALVIERCLYSTKAEEAVKSAGGSIKA